MPELYVRGLSQQDICQTLTDQLGLENVSPSVVSRVSQKLAEDFRRWHRRSLALYSILYLYWMRFISRCGLPESARLASWWPIRLNRTDGALVRVITPVGRGESEKSAQSRAVEFAQQMLPALDRYIPL